MCSCLALLLLSRYTVRGCHDLDVSYVCDHNVKHLGDLFVRDYPADSIVCVDLVANSRETLSYRETRLTFSAVIRGNNSLVTCDNSGVDINDTSFTHFPLRFYNVSQVVIQELSFEGCMRPVQFEKVKAVFLSFTNLR